jgi:hypothetical protein
MRWWSAGVFAIPRTLGFEDDGRRLDHWSRHGQDFAHRVSIAKYEAMADRFLTDRSLRPSLRCCTRPRGYKIRYDEETGAFGVLSPDGMIRTYMKPIPCCWVPVAFVDKRYCHQYADNLSYFAAEPSVWVSSKLPAL